MITLIEEGLPDDVVGVHVSGTLTREDYATVFVPAVERVLEAKKKVSVLTVFEDDVVLSAGSVLEDTYFGTRHLFAWGRMAMVSDSDFMYRATALMFPLLPFKARLFPTEQLDAAIAWVSSRD
ncbi:MAG: STAS/SEC14 domain-containing protein [Pseudomonadota bacterium]